MLWPSHGATYKEQALGSKSESMAWMDLSLIVFINIGITKTQIPNTMVHLVRNSLFLLLSTFIMSCSLPNTEESEKLEEISAEEIKRKEITFDCGYDCQLDGWVRKGVPFNQPNGSTPAWAFFYFKVSSSGEVDSLYHWGTLRSEVANKIEDNLYKTKGYWKIPDGFASSDYQWFVLPYFDLGEIPCFSSTNCTREDSIFQWSMRRLEGSMGNLQRVVTERHAKVIYPVSIDTSYPKM